MRAGSAATSPLPIGLLMYMPPRPPFNNPDAQVVYILDQVRALELELDQRLEDAGLQVGVWGCGVFGGAACS